MGLGGAPNGSGGAGAGAVKQEEAEAEGGGATGALLGGSGSGIGGGGGSSMMLADDDFEEGEDDGGEGEGVLDSLFEVSVLVDTRHAAAVAAAVQREQQQRQQQDIAYEGQAGGEYGCRSSTDPAAGGGGKAMHLSRSMAAPVWSPPIGQAAPAAPPTAPEGLPGAAAPGPGSGVRRGGSGSSGPLPPLACPALSSSSVGVVGLLGPGGTAGAPAAASSLQQAVAQAVRDCLAAEPAASGLPQEALAGLAPRAVQKVLGTLPGGGAGGAYDSPAGAAAFLSEERRARIARLVGGYVDKWVAGMALGEQRHQHQHRHQQQYEAQGVGAPASVGGQAVA